MVMIFQSEKALNHLMKYGYVFSFRVNRRKKNGYDWIARRRRGKAIAYVTVKEIAKIPISDLSHYLFESGFDSVNEWVEEIKLLNGYVPDSGYIYFVKLEAFSHGYLE